MPPTEHPEMSSWWWMTALAVLQAGAAISVFREGNAPLAGVYIAYGISNLLMILVHRG